MKVEKDRLENARQIIEQRPTIGLKCPHSGHEHERSLNLLGLGELPLAQCLAQPLRCRLLCLVATSFGHARSGVGWGVSQNLGDADEIIRNPS